MKKAKNAESRSIRTLAVTMSSALFLLGTAGCRTFDYTADDLDRERRHLADGAWLRGWGLFGKGTGAGITTKFTRTLETDDWGGDEIRVFKDIDIIEPIE